MAKRRKPKTESDEKLSADWLPPASLLGDFPVYTYNDGRRIQLYLSPRCIDKLLTQEGIKEASADPRTKHAPDVYAKVLVPIRPEEHKGEGYWEIRFHVNFDKDGTVHIREKDPRLGSVSKADWHIGYDKDLFEAEINAQHPDDDPPLTKGATSAETDRDFLPKQDDVPFPPLIDAATAAHLDIAGLEVGFRKITTDAEREALATQTRDAVELIEMFRDKELPMHRENGDRYSLSDAYQSLKTFVVSHARNPQSNVEPPEHLGIDSRPKRETEPPSKGKPRQGEHREKHPKRALEALMQDGNEPPSHTARVHARKARQTGRARGGDSSGKE